MAADQRRLSLSLSLTLAISVGVFVCLDAFECICVCFFLTVFLENLHQIEKENSLCVWGFACVCVMVRDGVCVLAYLCVCVCVCGGESDLCVCGGESDLCVCGHGCARLFPVASSQLMEIYTGLYSACWDQTPIGGKAVAQLPLHITTHMHTLTHTSTVVNLRSRTGAICPKPESCVEQNWCR